MCVEFRFFHDLSTSVWRSRRNSRLMEEGRTKLSRNRSSSLLWATSCLLRDQVRFNLVMVRAITSNSSSFAGLTEEAKEWASWSSRSPQLATRIEQTKSLLKFLSQLDLQAPWSEFPCHRQQQQNPEHRVQIIPVNPRSLPYFTTISRCPPILLFLLWNSRNLYGPNVVIWIITSIYYPKVVQLPDLLYETHPTRVINTSYKFQPICEINQRFVRSIRADWLILN